MNVKTLATTLLMVLSLTAQAGPGDHGGPHGGTRAHEGRPSPGHRISMLPEIATALLLGGLTYYVVNGTYYQKQDDRYVVVEAPQERDAALQVVDFNGKRYYVRDGHYYQRDINGDYTEVPRPAGL